MNSREVLVSVTSKKGAVIIQVLADSLSFDELESFGEMLQEVAEQNPAGILILDLSKVVTISSIVIGRIFRARKALIDSGGELRIVASNPNLLSVLNVCRLDKIVDIRATLDEALAELK
ncbi:MAG: STAS domain-containing protein [Planctomycetota bacterium]|nr:STAS domain-containing protein [Planctomycetota bacterium]MDA1138944.1 STAS domain-containing protein [Planctomycetota bacterium]